MGKKFVDIVGVESEHFLLIFNVVNGTIRRDSALMASIDTLRMHGWSIDTSIDNQVKGVYFGETSYEFIIRVNTQYDADFGDEYVEVDVYFGDTSRHRETETLGLHESSTFIADFDEETFIGLWTE